jgi:hypothetical protein
LHPKKQVLQTVDKGIDFLGFVVRPSHVLVRRRVIKRLKEKLWELNRNPEEITKPEEMRSVQSVVNSYYGHFRHAKTFGLRSNAVPFSCPMRATIHPNSPYFAAVKIGLALCK